jgi:hypothetical protein
MNKEVEILKIGSILPVMPIKGTRVYDTAQFKNKQTIMIVSDGGELFDYYVNILRNNCDDYNYLKTTKSIVGKPHSFKFNDDTLKGVSDGNPIIGQSYTINNGSWYTSKIEKIIDDYIIVTKNSVYAIHNLSDLRNKKLSNLGL